MSKLNLNRDKAVEIIENCLNSFLHEHTGSEKEDSCDAMQEIGECFLCEEHAPVSEAIAYLRKLKVKP